MFHLWFQATRVNLNNMLCPAVSDPFHGPFYRLFAIAHQTILIPSLGKIYALLARRLGWCPDEEESSVAILIKEEFSAKEASSDLWNFSETSPPVDIVKEDSFSDNVILDSEEFFSKGALRSREVNGDPQRELPAPDTDGLSSNGHLKNL